jgi:hypothetical protein
METDYEQQNMQCFSFTFDGSVVYNVPTLDYYYKPAYSALAHVMRALSIAIRDNTIVAHNGSTFDFVVLGYKYRIPVVKCYDTMIAMHRCYPSIEKSLGHCTSLWSWQPFHKDQDSRGYRTKEQMMSRMSYCGKDVFTMYLIKQAIDKYAKTIIGLEHSIATAQSMIVPYLVTTMQGIKVDWQLREKKRYENDRLMERYLKMIEICIGEEGLKEMRSVIKSKHASGMPGSNKQCVQYFHNMLGYPVVQFNPPDQHGRRNPSLAALALYKLRLKHENPVIDLCNIYRSAKLETSTPLGFIPWKGDDNKVYYDKTQ